MGRPAPDSAVAEGRGELIKWKTAYCNLGKLYMDRRKKIIEDNQFVVRLQAIIDRIDKVEYSDINNSIESERVTSVVSHIIEILNTVDSKYFAISSLKVLESNISNIESHITNRDDEYIESNIITISDNFVDAIISEIEKYNVLKGGKAAQYARELRERVEEFEKYLERLSSIKSSINTFYNKLFEGEGAIEKRIDDLISNIEREKEKIDDFERYLYEEDEEGESMVSNIKRKLAEINRNYKEAKEILNKEKEYFEEIKNHYVYIFGDEEEDLEEVDNKESNNE